MAEEKSPPSCAAVAAIEATLRSWKMEYAYTVFESPHMEWEDTLEYQAVLSKPTKSQPVALAAANLFFTYSASREKVLGYRIEYEQVEHWLSDKVPFHSSWIDRVIANKLRIGERFDHIVRDTRLQRPNTAASQNRDGITELRSFETDSTANASIDGCSASEDRKRIKAGCMMEMMKQSSRSIVALAETSSEVEGEKRSEEVEKVLQDIRDFEHELIRRFKTADFDGNGVLDSFEFFRILKDCGLRFTQEEIILLMGEADENDDGKVDYTEFVPVAVELLQVISSAQGAVFEIAERESHIQDEELRELSGAELGTTLAKIDSKITSKCPESATTRTIPRQVLRQCLGDRRNGLLREEINMCMGLVQVNPENSGEVLIHDLHDVIKEVRLRTVHVMIQRQTASDTELYLLQQFEAADERINGTITGQLNISQLRDVLLFDSPQILVSRVQAFGIVGEAQVDGNTGMVEYRDFAGLASYILDEMFDPRALKERHELTRRADIQPVELLGGRGKEELEQELKEFFLKYDENNNGTLDHEEFVECIEALQLDLPQNYLRALLVVADGDSSGDVDYGEFIEFAYEYLLHLVRERAIKDLQSGTKMSRIRKLSLTVSSRAIAPGLPRASEGSNITDT